MPRVALAVVLAVHALGGGCACSDAYGKSVASCVEVEQLDPDEFPTEPVSITGPVVDGAGVDFVAACAGALRHSITVDSGARGRVRFSWEHEIVDLDVPIAGTVTVEQIGTNLWEGGSSFVIHDDDGLALVINGADSIRTVDGARIEHGFWRGSSVGGCGVSSVTGTRITTPDGASHDVSNGDSVDVELDGAPFRFHAFSTFTFGPAWWCTDASNSVDWALVRTQP